MRRILSVQFRTLVALLCVLLLSFGFMSIFLSREMSANQYQSNMRVRKDAVESLGVLMDGFFYDELCYAEQITSAFALRPISVNKNNAVSQINARQLLSTMMGCNQRIIDMCLYFHNEDFFISTLASYSMDGFIECYFWFDNMSNVDLYGLFRRPMDAVRMYNSLPTFIPMGYINTYNSVASISDCLLMLMPIPYRSASPYATLGVFMRTDGFIEQLSLAAGEGCARIISANGDAILSYESDARGKSGNTIKFTKQSNLFNLTYEIEVDRNVLMRSESPTSRIATIVLLVVAAFCLVCVLFTKWVNQPINQVLTHIGSEHRLLSNESTLIREYIGQLAERAEAGQMYASELLIRRLLTSQSLSDYDLEKCEERVKGDYAHYAAFLVRLDRPVSKVLSLTCIVCEHSITHVLQESQPETLLGIIACDLSGDELVNQVRAALADDVFAGHRCAAIGPICEDILLLSHSAAVASALLKDMIFQGKAGVELSANVGERVSAYPAEAMRGFTAALQRHNAEELKKALMDVTAVLSSDNVSPEVAAMVIYDLKQMLPGLDSALPMDEIVYALNACTDELCREFSSAREQAQSGDSAWKNGVAEVIDAQLESPDFGISYMAQRFRMSDSAFSHMFKRVFGVTFISYVNRLKIERAKLLLSAPENTIDMIAARLGYSSASNFSRMFKSIEGMTPSAYRQQLVFNS